MSPFLAELSHRYGLSREFWFSRVFQDNPIRCRKIFESQFMTTFISSFKHFYLGAFLCCTYEYSATCKLHAHILETRAHKLLWGMWSQRFEYFWSTLGDRHINRTIAGKVMCTKLEASLGPAVRSGLRWGGRVGCHYWFSGGDDSKSKM